MKQEASQLPTQRLLQNIDALTRNMTTLARQMQRDTAVDQYFDQFGFQKTEVIANFIRYAQHLQRVIAIINSNNKVNINVYGQLITHLLLWLSENTPYSDTHTPIETATAIFELDSKMICFEQFSQSALFFKNDITSSPRSSYQQYHQVYQKIEYIHNENATTTKNQYVLMKNLMTITNAAVLTEISQSNGLLAVLAFGLSYPRFLIDNKQAQLRNKAFLRQPNLLSLQRIWNLPQKGIIGKLKYVQYEGIKTNQELYIPRDYTQKSDILNTSDNSIKIRILSHKKIHFWQQQKEGCSNCCLDNETIEPIDTIILHAHGGGFIALSSSTMQSYTRRWANQLKVPVLSIDYGKPPLHTFPQPVYDMLRVYRFVTQQLNQHCNLSPANIILAGDSAGGNLMCSLMGLILKLKLKMPKGIFLAYPACDLRKVYSPSRIHSFSDAILHPPLLLLCLKEYLGKNSYIKQSDPLATPLLLTQEYVSASKGDFRFPLKWPKTRIIVGELDPLLDDSLRLCEKLRYSGIDYQCKIFKDLGHGFMSIQKVISQGEKGILKSIQLLKELLS